MTNQDERWLTIREASLALNLSELSIRRRIKDGRLAHRFQAGKYLVHLGLPAPRLDEPMRQTATDSAGDRLRSVPADQSVASTHPSATPSVTPVAAIENLLPEYTRLAEQAGRAAVLAERLAALEQQYASLQEGALSLANRNGWLEGKLEEREEEIKLLADSQHRRSWWQRLFGG